MRIHFVSAFILIIVAPTYGVMLSDTVSNIQVSGRVQLSNTGLAPVPAFSFDSPIAFGFLSVKKKRLSFEPDFAVGLNGKPWMTNNWLRYSILEKNQWKGKVGVNPSLFFENESLDSGKEIIHVLRTITTEAAAEFKAHSGIFRFAYMNIRGCDKGALSGHFMDAQSEFTLGRDDKKLLVHIKPGMFYFNFDGNVDGFFASGAFDIKHTRLPITFFTQGAMPLWANFSGSSFKWNFGLSMSL